MQENCNLLLEDCSTELGSFHYYRITSVKAPWGNIRNQFWGVRKHPVSDNIPVGHYSKRPVGYYPKRWVYMWGERLDVFYWASLPLLTVRECHELEMDISFAFSYILIFNLARNMFLLKKFSISNHLHQKTKHYFQPFRQTKAQKQLEWKQMECISHF